MSERDPDELKEQGLTLFAQGERDQALQSFQEAAEAYGLSGDIGARAEMQNNMGVIYRLQRKWDAAGQSLTEAARDFAEVGDDSKHAQALGNLGDLEASQGHYRAAGQYYSDAAEIFARVGDRQKQSQVLRAYALAELRRRAWISSLNLMTQSLNVSPNPSLLQRVGLRFFRLALHLLTGE